MASGALAERRERAAALTRTLELPQFKGKPGWEFTDISALDLSAYAPAPANGGISGPAERAPLFSPPHVAELRQLDAGEATLSGGGELPDGVIVSSLDGAPDELVARYLGTVVPGDDVFVARNDAGFRGGAFVYVPRGVALSQPLLLTAIQTATGTELNRRTLIVVDEGATAEVWEQCLSAGPDVDGVFNTVVELVVADGARLRFIAGQDLSERTWVFGTQRAEVARDAVLDWVALGFGSTRGHVRMETRLGGPGAEARVTGAYASHRRQHIDFDTTQEHAAPNTTSDLAFRGVLQGRSTAVWKGNIIVDPGAQKTDAFQESRNLLLSKRAHADAIPGLEIQANDVRCTHAAAVAQVDPEQLFYLRAHGLGEEIAKRLVIEGFLSALVERFEEGPVREELRATLERRLALILGE
ncbi:MAG: Fe-S cluster assembly protein SufD [Solirubrobacterales bacterium]|nr:Fe-S cluster assembly protein SufD [Solirubrobacterales bacterium]MBV9714375.1 Fe-S cluster assembly protein SufD [Solirubrobacterales bacterium]